MEELLRREVSELELIVEVEGCSHLASIEFALGNIESGDSWLLRCDKLLTDLNPGLKVRTLAALSFLFDACMERMALTRSGAEASLE
jgi:hypothetical protein